MTLLFPLAGLIVGLVIGRWRALWVTVAAAAALMLLLALGTDVIEDAEDAGYATALAVFALGGTAIGVAIRRAAPRGRDRATESGA